MGGCVMSYLSQRKLEGMNFRKLGKNVKISDKASIYDPEKIEIGDNCRIDDFCVISGKLIFGAYVHIAPFCLIAGGEEGIVLGDFSGVSYGGQIFSQSDDYTGRFMVSPLISEEYKNEKKAQVVIGRHVVIGASAIVFPGVHVAEGCSIGALTLVTKSTDPWGIYLGIPAKRAKEKSRDVLNVEKNYLEATGTLI
jgi:acetyltransferase-like isoleucine patch superfamily enzyme